MSAGELSQIGSDLGRKLQERFADVLAQDLKIMQAILPPDEIAFVLLGGATMVGRSVTATIAGVAGGDDAGKLYDLTLEALIERLMDGREKAMALIAASRASATA